MAISFIFVSNSNYLNFTIQNWFKEPWLRGTATHSASSCERTKIKFYSLSIFYVLCFWMTINSVHHYYFVENISAKKNSHNFPLLKLAFQDLIPICFQFQVIPKALIVLRVWSATDYRTTTTTRTCYCWR